MIFEKISIINDYSEIRLQSLSTKISMYFHVIGIKEDQNDKYSIDIVFDFDKIWDLREFLQHHNIVLLNLTEYKKSNFGSSYIIFQYKNKTYKAFFDSANILHSIKQFILIGFEIHYFNTIPSHTFSDEEVAATLQQLFLEQKNIQNLKSQPQNQGTTYEKQVYKDIKLQNTITIVDQVLSDIDKLEKYKNSSLLSTDKLRQLHIYAQELTKLKMWRNIDKIIDLLEKTYYQIFDFQQQLLLTEPVNPIFLWSVVTDMDLELEIYKQKKAQNIKKIWAKRTLSDNYYLSFEKTWIYLKFLFEDFKNLLKNRQLIVNKLFDYVEIFFIFTTLILSLCFWFHKVSYSLYQNAYLYYVFIQIWVYSFVFYLFKAFKTQKFTISLLMFFISFVFAFAAFFLLKNNLSF